MEPQELRQIVREELAHRSLMWRLWVVAGLLSVLTALLVISAFVAARDVILPPERFAGVQTVSAQAQAGVVVEAGEWVQPFPPATLTTVFGQGTAIEGITALSYLHKTTKPSTSLTVARSYLSATLAGMVWTMEPVPDEEPYEVDAALIEWSERRDFVLELPGPDCITPNEVYNDVLGEVRQVGLGEPYLGEVWLVVSVERLEGCP